jgi:hypothetical protein
VIANNLRVLAAPFLLAVFRWPSGRLTRRLGDVLIAALIAQNTIAVGLALGRSGDRLLPYVPQLPLEWTAPVIAGAAWLSARAGVRLRALAVYALVTLALTLLEMDHRRETRDAQIQEPPVDACAPRLGGEAVTPDVAVQRQSKPCLVGLGPILQRDAAEEAAAATLQDRQHSMTAVLPLALVGGTDCRCCTPPQIRTGPAGCEPAAVS